MVGEGHSCGIQLCGLANSIRHGAMWLVSGIRATFNYAYGLAIYIGYDTMWLASGICEAFSYVGWQVGSSMKLRG